MQISRLSHAAALQPILAPPSQAPVPPAHDRVQLTRTTPTAAAPRPAGTRRGWLAAGTVALAAAVPMLGGAAGAAFAATPPALSAPAQPVAMADTQFAAMKQLAVPGKFDNDYAQRARMRYGDMTSRAWQEAQAFQQQAATLVDQGNAIEQKSAANDSAVSMVQQDDKTTLTQNDGTTSIEDTRQGDSRTVHVHDASGDRQLDITPALERLTVGDKVDTVYLQSGHGFKAGDFRMQISLGRMGNAETVVSGLSVLQKNHIVLSGFAGNIDTDRQETVTVPEATVQAYPQAVLEYNTSEHRVSEVLNAESKKSERIEVLADGSTHNQTVFDGHTSNFDTPPAAATPDSTPE